MFNQQTARPVNPKKDVWSLGCVFSEAVVWCVLGVSGLQDYRDKRKAETAILRKLNRTAYSGCFHDGAQVLPIVQHMHDRVRKQRGQYDLIINDILPIIEEMLSPVEQRQTALNYRDRFRAALETAQRMSYPGPFQVGPECSPQRKLQSAYPRSITGLGVTFSPVPQHYTPPDGGVHISTSSALASGSTLSSSSYDPSPRPISRRFTEQLVRTQSVGCPISQQAKRHTLATTHDSDAPEEHACNSIHIGNKKLPGFGKTASDGHSIDPTSSQNQLVTNGHRDDLATPSHFATIPEVLSWISLKRSKRSLHPISLILNAQLISLRGTDQVRILLLISTCTNIVRFSS
jgi:hypothetical protein